MNRLRRDLLVYYGYKLTTSLTLYRPVMFLYFRAVGLTWVQIAVLEAVGSLTTVLTEVPTGYAGDRVGRLNSLLAGTLLVALALLGIAVADSFLLLGVCYPLWSLGWNLRSGSDSAWLYDRLAAADSPGRYADARGRAKAATRTVGVLGALVGGALGVHDLALPFLAAAALTVLGAPALLVLRDVDQRQDRDHPTPRESVDLVREALTHRRLGPFVGYHFVLFAGVTSVVFMYAQPVVEAHAAALSYGGPVELLLGALYAGISLVSAALSYHTGFVAERIGIRRWFTVVPVLVGVALAGVAVAPVLTLPAILLSQGVADVTGTLAGQYVNDRLGSEGRATVLSAMRMVKKCASIPFFLVAGWAAGVGLAIPEIVATSGALLTVGGLALGRWALRGSAPSLPHGERDPDSTSPP